MYLHSVHMLNSFPFSLFARGKKKSVFYILGMINIAAPVIDIYVIVPLQSLREEVENESRVHMLTEASQSITLGTVSVGIVVGDNIIKIHNIVLYKSLKLVLLL